MGNELCFLVTLLMDGALKRVSIILQKDKISDDLIEYPMEPDSRTELWNYLPEHLREGAVVEVVGIWDMVDARPKPAKMVEDRRYLHILQRELKEWDKKNFGDQPSYRSLLGATEEIGELAHAHLKEEHGIRESNYEEDAKDAIGDTIIYLANYCNARGFNLQDIIKETWDQVKQRDWVTYPKTGKPPEEAVSHSTKESLMRET